jgi:hypothetical protein
MRVLSIFTGNGLVSGRKVDDAEPGVPQRYTIVLRHPVALSIRPTVVKGLSRLLQDCLRHRQAARDKCDNPTHFELYSSGFS